MGNVCCRAVDVVALLQAHPKCVFWLCVAGVGEQRVHQPDSTRTTDVADHNTITSPQHRRTLMPLSPELALQSQFQKLLVLHNQNEVHKSVDPLEINPMDRLKVKNTVRKYK